MEVERENTAYVRDAYDAGLEDRFRAANFEKESSLKKDLAASLFAKRKKISFQVLLSKEGMEGKGMAAPGLGRSKEAGILRQREREIPVLKAGPKQLGR